MKMDKTTGHGVQIVWSPGYKNIWREPYMERITTIQIV